MASTRQEQPEQLTDEDRGYGGSRFSDVVDALFANPYQRVWGGEGQPPLPVGEVTFRSVVGGILSFAKPTCSRKASERTLDSGADLRWGADRKGFRRLVHPNGVCLIGQWQIVEDTGYSGYFSKGSTALVIARYSTCCTETRRGHTRSLSMVGKLFPTTDPNHALPLRTANFITQEDIGGADTEFINDAELRNAPDTTVSRRGAGAPLLLPLASCSVASTSSRASVSCIRSPSSANRRERRRGRRSSCGCSSLPTSRESPASISTSATKSWRRYSTVEIRCPSARSHSRSK